MLTLDVVLGGIAGVLNLVAYLLYNRQMDHGKSHPKVATWLLWGFVYSLNSGSYLSLSGGHWIKIALPLASAAACLGTLLCALVRGRFRHQVLDAWEKAVLVIALAASLVWWHGQEAAYANLCLQTAFIVSFMPTVVGVWREPQSERWLPWVMWAVAYAVMTYSVWLHWRSWSEMAYPLNGLCLNAAVGLLSRR